MPDQPNAGGAPPPTGGPAMPMPPQTGPTSPATVAPRNEGMRQQARVLANLGLNLLEKAAGMYGGSNDEDGAEIMSSVLKLRKKYGSVAQDLTRAEVKLAGEKAAPIQQPPMGQVRDMVQSRLAQLPGSTGVGAPPSAVAA